MVFYFRGEGIRKRGVYIEGKTKAVCGTFSSAGLSPDIVKKKEVDHQAISSACRKSIFSLLTARIINYKPRDESTNPRKKNELAT